MHLAPHLPVATPIIFYVKSQNIESHFKIKVSKERSESSFHEVLNSHLGLLNLRISGLKLEDDIVPYAASDFTDKCR